MLTSVRINEWISFAYAILMATVLSGCDHSTSPDPCEVGDGVVSVNDRGILDQNGCMQYIGASQSTQAESPTGNVIVSIENSQFSPAEPVYADYLNGVMLYSRFEEGQFPTFGDWVEITDGRGDGWELSFHRDGDGYATVRSGELVVDITPAVPAMTASFEAVQLEWPDGESDTISGVLEATLDIHCEYCDEAVCDPDSSVPDSWPPTSDYCQELEAALLGS